MKRKTDHVHSPGVLLLILSLSLWRYYSFRQFVPQSVSISRKIAIFFCLRSFVFVLCFALKSPLPPMLAVDHVLSCSCSSLFLSFCSFSFLLCLLSTACQITTILDLVGGDASSITDTCNTVGDAMDGTFKTLIGCFILIVSQIIVIAYWYK